MRQVAPSFRSRSLFSIVPVLFSLVLMILAGCGGGGSDRASLSISASAVTEGDSDNVEMVFTVTLSKNAEATVTLDYATSDNTATTADGDYTAVNGSITIPNGSNSATVSVFAIGDTVFEQDEAINLVISNAQGIALAQASYTGQGTITNDDDADPKGYFTGSGTLNSTSLDDLTGMAYNNRLMVFSPSANVLYDITFTSITLQDYTATARVYLNGDMTDPGSIDSVALSGTTDESVISGTFSGGSALGDGSFTLNFDENNNLPATLDRIIVTGTIQNRWGGDIYGVEVSQDEGRFTGFNDGSYFGSDQNLNACGYSGNLVIPPSELNNYQLAHDVIDAFNCQFVSSGHTGFASVVSINSVDTLVYAFANGDFGFFAIMEKI